MAKEIREKEELLRTKGNIHKVGSTEEDKGGREDRGGTRNRGYTEDGRGAQDRGRSRD